MQGLTRCDLLTDCSLVCCGKWRDLCARICDGSDAVLCLFAANNLDLVRRTSVLCLGRCDCYRFSCVVFCLLRGFRWEISGNDVEHQR
jgi:hypothetical protein